MACVEIEARAKKRASWIAVAVLVILPILLFYRTVSFGFVSWDDGVNIFGDPHLNPPTGGTLADFWRTPYFQSYIPVTRSLWWLLASFSSSSSGLTAMPFHIANLVLHLGNTLLVFAILRLLVKDLWACTICAAAYAIDPIQVEAVAWATGMKDLLGALLSLLALWIFLNDAVKPGRKEWLLVATVCFCLATLSKAGAVSLPLIAATVCLLILHRWGRRQRVVLGTWTVIAALAALVVQWAETHPHTDAPSVGILQRFLVAGDALSFYSAKTVLPTGFAADYGRTPAYVLSQSWVYLSATIGLALVLVAVLLRRKAPYFSAGFLIFAAGLLPVLGLVPFHYQTLSTVADRYVYVGLLGMVVAVGGLLTKYPAPPLRCVAIVAVAGLGIVSWLLVPVWQDSSSLFARVLEVNPRSWTAYNNLGVGLTQTNPALALKDFQTAVRIKPDYPEAQYNLAAAEQDRGNLVDAEKGLKRALLERPNYYSATTRLVQILFTQRRFDEAKQVLDSAIQQAPSIPELHFNLGVTEVYLGELPEAKEEAREALRLRPDYPRASNLLGSLSQRS